MGEMLKIELVPHEDIELGRERRDIEAFLNLPEAGLDENTGVIMVIEGLGSRAHAQSRSELRQHLADAINCIAVGVNYFGIQRNDQLQISPAFLYNINRIYQLEITLDSFKKAISEEDIYRILAEAVIGKGITSLDIRCQPTLVTGRGEYQSWGFLPAIDCLQVLGEVIKQYEINSRRIMAYGNGYGAYIALLLGKFAPHTFSAIIDRGAYCRSELKHIACGEVMEADYTYAFNIRYSDLKFTIASGSNNPWTIEDELSPHYFSDSHRKIRSLLEEKHRMASETKYYIFHSEADESASIQDKDRCVDILQKYNAVLYNRYLAKDMDELEEEQQFPYDKYNQASDQDVFDWLCQVAGPDLGKSSEETDFSLNSQHEFDCGEKKYRFEFDDTYNLKVTIE